MTTIQTLFIYSMQQVKIEISQANIQYLKTKLFTDDKFPIPNNSLDKKTYEGLNKLHKALMGEGISPKGSTYTVKTDGKGNYQSLYKPLLAKYEDGQPFLKFGDHNIPLTSALEPEAVKDSDVSVGFTDKNNRAYFTLSLLDNKTFYTMELPVFQSDTKNPASAEALSNMLESNPSAIADVLGVFGSDYQGFKGYSIPVSSLPLGEYKIVGFDSYDNGVYGKSYYFHTLLPDTLEPFEAPVSVKADDGTWEKENKLISKTAKVKGNNPMKNYMKHLDPVITEEQPATLHVLEHGTFNGYPKATVRMEFCKSVNDPNVSLSLGF